HARATSHHIGPARADSSLSRRSSDRRLERSGCPLRSPEVDGATDLRRSGPSVRRGRQLVVLLRYLIEQPMALVSDVVTVLPAATAFTASLSQASFTAAASFGLSSTVPW